MASRDNAYKNKSIPYLAQIFGYNRNELSDADISQARSYGDLSYIANPTTLQPTYGGSFYPQKDNYIRILRPMRSEIVSAYLTMALQMAASEPSAQFYISITKTTSETDLTVVQLTQDQILKSHRQITGRTTPFSNTPGQLINLFRVDLADAIPKFGSADFRSDCYVLGIHFPNTPVASGFHLFKLQIDGSALVVA